MDRDRFIARVAERLGRRDRHVPPVPVASPRTPEDGCSADRDALVHLFCERLADTGGTATLVPTRRAAQEAVAAILAERGWSSLACPPGVRWPHVSDLWTPDVRAADLGLSEADLGIAETGTVVVRHEGELGRSLSLVPRAVGFFLPLSGLRSSLGEVIAALDLDAGPLPPACVSFISGPSHSGDIAGIFVTGVHGPGVVYVWLIADE